MDMSEIMNISKRSLIRYYNIIVSYLFFLFIDLIILITCIFNWTATIPTIPQIFQSLLSIKYLYLQRRRSENSLLKCMFLAKKKGKHLSESAFKLLLPNQLTVKRKCIVCQFQYNHVTQTHNGNSICKKGKHGIIEEENHDKNKQN